MSNDLEIGSFEWEAVGEDELNVADRLSVRLADPGRNWVRVTVVDDATGKPIPCRVHFRSAEGVPYQPVGHQQHAGDGLGEPKSAGWWAQELDLGGDVRLGATSYAYIDGHCEGWLPRGDVLAESGSRVRVRTIANEGHDRARAAKPDAQAEATGRHE